MDEKQLEQEPVGAAALRSFISYDKSEKPRNKAVAWILGMAFFLLFVMAGNGGMEFLPLTIVLVIVSLIASSVINNIRWRIYLKKRQQSLDDLCRDRRLFAQMIQDYVNAPRHWGRLALGEKFLFLQGHLPISYGKVFSVQYQIKEQQETSTGTIPEKLGLLVELTNGQSITLSGLPCPGEKTTLKKGMFTTHRVRVSLDERVSSDPRYTRIIKRIEEKRAEARCLDEQGNKSIGTDLTY